jgi:hypothetical protein
MSCYSLQFMVSASLSLSIKESCKNNRRREANYRTPNGKMVTDKNCSVVAGDNVRQVVLYLKGTSYLEGCV